MPELCSGRPPSPGDGAREGSGAGGHRLTNRGGSAGAPPVPAAVPGGCGHPRGRCPEAGDTGEGKGPGSGRALLPAGRSLTQPAEGEPVPLAQHQVEAGIVPAEAPPLPAGQQQPAHLGVHAAALVPHHEGVHGGGRGKGLPALSPAAHGAPPQPRQGPARPPPPGPAPHGRGRRPRPPPTAREPPRRGLTRNQNRPSEPDPDTDPAPAPAPAPPRPVRPCSRRGGAMSSLRAGPAGPGCDTGRHLSPAGSDTGWGLSPAGICHRPGSVRGWHLLVAGICQWPGSDTGWALSPTGHRPGFVTGRDL